MQGAMENAHIIVEVGSGLVAMAGFITTLMIRNNQSTVKEELVLKQNELRETMDQKYAENAMAIAVHIARDEQQFNTINATLDRMDRKLDHMKNSKV